jgi:nucleoside-diphosphate-sugar epimerase
MDNAQTRSSTTVKPNYILFGTTSSFNPVNPSMSPWCDRKTIDNTANVDRVAAENRLLELGGCVLSLAGLFDEGRRHPSNFLDRVAPSKEFLAGKKSVHYIHGRDVARGVLAVAKDFTAGERWLLTNLRVLDWWDIVSCYWGDEEKQKTRASWVKDLMLEYGVKGLPRSPELLGRALDSVDFWRRFNTYPIYTKL